MVIQTHGNLEMVNQLLDSDEPKFGLATFWECGCLDLSIEALVLQPRFRLLLTDGELITIMERLSAYVYDGLDS